MRHDREVGREERQIDDQNFAGLRRDDATGVRFRKAVDDLVAVGVFSGNLADR